MAGWDHIHNLMAEIGEQLDADQVTEFPDEGFWYVALDDDAEVGVHYDEALDRIVLTHGLGRPAEGARLTMYDTLLAYNAQWHETGGIRMGLDEPGGDVVMIADLTATGLNAGDLAAVLADLVDKGRTWRELLTGPGDAASAAAPHPGEPGAIRV